MSLLHKLGGACGFASGLRGESHLFALQPVGSEEGIHRTWFAQFCLEILQLSAGQVNVEAATEKKVQDKKAAAKVSRCHRMPETYLTVGTG